MRAKASRIRMRWLWPVLAVVLLSLSMTMAPQAAAKGMLKIGLLQEPKSLNVWLASDAWSSRVMDLIYQRLYVYHPQTLQLVPWLAAKMPQYDPKTVSYLVKLRPAKWSDGSDFTAADVAFTGRLCKDFKVPRFSSKWRFVKKIEVVDKHTVRFYLKKPKATFVSRTLTTPMVQQKQWAPVVAAARKAKKPLARLLQYPIKRPVGTGPFVLQDWRSGVYLVLVRNKHFFGSGQTIGGLKLGPYISSLLFKIFGTTDAAILALRKGDIDFYWNGIQAGYLDQIKDDKRIKLYQNKKSALYYLGFNVRKKPFSDRAFRQAVATLIDKNFIVRRVLQGQGIAMSSIVPPGNIYWYNPKVPVHGNTLKRQQRIKAAYQILKKAGYTWETPPVDAAGKLQKGKGIKLPGGKPMKEFTILTPPADYDPARAACGTWVQEWLKPLGIPGFARPMSFGALIQQVKQRRHFDMFVLGYGKLSLDPGYLRVFFHSRMDKPRGWNMSGYRNKVYDKLAVKSDNAMENRKRRELIYKMQAILARDVPYLPLYNPLLVEGVRIDRFKGWVPMLGGVGNLWSFCRIKQAK